MGKIIKIDLNNSKIISLPNTLEFSRSGRALAVQLVMENVEDRAEYLSDENCIALAPGLLTGTQAPTTGRLTVASKKSGLAEIRSINISGPATQKLASLDVDAILISGVSKRGNTVVHIHEEGIDLHNMAELKERTVSYTINHIQQKWGEDTSIIGIGPAGERVMPIASVFSTYEKGEPQFYCTRGNMGDVFGYKGIKAIAVTTKKHFAARVQDLKGFRAASKNLGKLIISNPVCGGALPAYGSITLIQMMKQGRNFVNESIKKESEENSLGRKSERRERINKVCAPNCVIGCLNKHSSKGGTSYSSPAESEAVAACKNLFSIENNTFVSTLNKKCFEQGIDTIEFLSSCAMLIKVSGQPANEENLKQLLKELEESTPLGRILGCGTQGIRGLYADRKELQELVTKPAYLDEGRFKLTLPYKARGCEEISDLEYLYGFMTISGNLGLCLFASFALLENEQGIKILTDLVNTKCGCMKSESQIIRAALGGLELQKNKQEQSYSVGIASYIPEFVKVLYRYFGTELA